MFCNLTKDIFNKIAEQMFSAENKYRSQHLIMNITTYLESEVGAHKISKVSLTNDILFDL